MSCVTGFPVPASTPTSWSLGPKVPGLESDVDDCTVEFPECLEGMKFLTGFDLERTLFVVTIILLRRGFGAILKA